MIITRTINSSYAINHFNNYILLRMNYYLRSFNYFFQCPKKCNFITCECKKFF